MKKEQESVINTNEKGISLPEGIQAYHLPSGR